MTSIKVSLRRTGRETRQRVQSLRQGWMAGVI